MGQPEELIVYLAMSDLHEASIARAWEKVHAKEARGKFRVVYGLQLPKMHPGITVMTLTRGNDRTPLEESIWDPERQKAKIKRAKPEGMVGELRVGPPVRVADYWIGSKDDYGSLSGDIDRVRFHDAIAAGASPNVAKIHPGQPDTLILDWA